MFVGKLIGPVYKIFAESWKMIRVEFGKSIVLCQDTFIDIAISVLNCSS